MQELALLLSSLAGAASAVAVHKMPRGRGISTIGASRRVRSQIEALENEQGLLNKAVARLYDGGDLPAEKRDALLEKYQGRLSEVRARIDGLNAAGSHPDLGPVGDGLLALMDQRLSGLDARLHEISARMQPPRPEKPPEKRAPERPRPEPKARAAEMPAPDRNKSLDMVTLTVHPAGAAAAPALAALPPRPVPEPAAVQEPAVVEPAPEPEAAPEPAAVQEPAVEPAAARADAESGQDDAQMEEYDDENLEEVKKRMLETLDKIEQAEVE